MKLVFRDQKIELEALHSVEELIETINGFLEVNYYFSHLISDGKEIYEEPEKFLTKNIWDIDSLEIIAVPAKKFINDLLLSTEEYTNRAVIQIPKLYNEFYTNSTTSSWGNLEEFLEGIQWMSTMIDVVDQSVERPFNWNEMHTHVSALQTELENLEEALENTDTVLIADMLQYELLPVFEAIAIFIKRTIDAVGARYELN